MGTLVNGIKEIFATAKTTGSNVMLCGNDGTPDGHMTMSNLASVLGVSFPYNDSARPFGSNDANGIMVELVYDNNTNTYPSQHGICVRFLQNDAKLGGAIYITSDDEFYFARKWVSWASWKKLS